jgi:hypothetical protein
MTLRALQGRNIFYGQFFLYVPTSVKVIFARFGRFFKIFVVIVSDAEDYIDIGKFQKSVLIVD